MVNADALLLTPAMSSRHDDGHDTGRTSDLFARFDRERIAESIGPETVQPVVKLLLGGAAVVFLLGIVSMLPGVDRLVPETPITFLALATAVLTVALIGALVTLAHSVEKLVYVAGDGPEEVRLMTAVIAKHLVVLTAVLVAYYGFAGVMTPFLAVTDSVWLYDVGFLALALVPTAFIAYYAYRALDPSAAYLTERLLASGETTVLPGPAAADEEGDGPSGTATADADGS